MKGSTNDYYQLFLEAKSSFVEDEIKNEISGDFSDYKIIYSELSKLLNSSSGIGIDSQNTRQQLVIEKVLNPKSSELIDESLQIFQVIRDAITDKVFIFTNKHQWIKAIKLSILYLLYQKIKVDHMVPEEYIFIANSLLYLKKRGFDIESIDGYIKLEDPELVRLATAINYRVEKLGKQGFVKFISVIGKNYSDNEKRFFFYKKRPTIPTFQEPSTPYGYVFNLFCKNLNLTCKLKIAEQEKFFNEIQNLSTHLATIIDVEKMSPWDNINVDSENIIKKLREWVLYPEIYYLPQLSPLHGRKIFPRIFELLEKNTKDSLSEIMLASRIMEKLENYLYQEGALSGEFTEDNILSLCIDLDSPKNILKMLNSISKPANEINKNYLSPFDSTKSNIKETPLIRIKSGYIITNIATYNMAKYRALLKISDKYNPKTEQNLGFALESFIKENFEASNVKYHHSFEYLSPEYMKKITDTNRNQGECDFIVESNDYIFLIEVKKKGLTKDSLSGSPLHLLIDTTLSFIKSINQLTTIELILLNEGKIKNSNNTKTINLDGRDIFKLILSLEDMASLQCDNIKSSILHGLYNTKFSVSNESAIEPIDKINKTLNEFTRLHSELMGKSDDYKHSPFHRVSYLSTPQLLTLLEDVNNNEDFSRNICR
ncbi:hypothetical protein AB8E32_18040 [Marinomonas polaris]|uniref:hypothetical protein n=1 Tax=Marinomonas polaris TaxID=293552 RepID=UPI0035133138